MNENKSKTYDFTEKARVIHGDKYDYSKVEYVKAIEKVTIVCKIHGDFQQIPSDHLGGSGCIKCSGIYKPTTEEFIEKSKLIHGDKYDYSNVEYISVHKKIKLVCKSHGEFQQTPDSHLRGCGCNDCGILSTSNKQRSNTEEFNKKAKEIHGDKYDYSKVEYVKAVEKIIIICREHGEYLQTPNSHLNNNGCRKCAVMRNGINQRSNIEEFIEKSKEIHKEKYNYTKVEYINSKTKLTIICKEHGDFEQTPSTHLKGGGCNICGNQSSANLKIKSNKGEFIENAQKIHGDKYDYSKVEYVNSISKVIVICKMHGEFEQTPRHHIERKQGCRKCAVMKNGNSQRSNVEEFIRKSNHIHGNKYDYSKVEYMKAIEKVIIICREHGEYLQTPNSHLNSFRSQGCNKCGFENIKLSRLLSQEEFIKKAKEKHKDKYDYSKVDYKGGKQKILIICKEHGEFLQCANKHLYGGCKKCANILIGNSKRSNKEEFIERARNKHGDKYDYSNVEYDNAREKVVIICKTHGEFQQTPDSHLKCAGCPLCVNKSEGKLYEKLQIQYPSTIPQFSPEWIGRRRFDFCIPEHNIIIELDGRQHFQDIEYFKSSFKENQENDKEKEELATQYNYCVIRLLQEDVFYDTYDWFKELLENIQTLIDEKPLIQNIYMDKNDEYEEYV